MTKADLHPSVEGTVPSQWYVDLKREHEQAARMIRRSAKALREAQMTLVDEWGDQSWETGEAADECEAWLRLRGFAYLLGEAER